MKVRGSRIIVHGHHPSASRWMDAVKQRQQQLRERRDHPSALGWIGWVETHASLTDAFFFIFFFGLLADGGSASSGVILSGPQAEPSAVCR